MTRNQKLQQVGNHPDWLCWSSFHAKSVNHQPDFYFNARETHETRLNKVGSLLSHTQTFDYCSSMSGISDLKITFLSKSRDNLLREQFVQA